MFALTVVHDLGDYVQNIGVDYKKLQISELETWSASMRKNGYKDVVAARLQKMAVRYTQRRKDK